MEAVLQWLGKNWGNLASVVGLIATVAGLIFAIRQINRTKMAAEAAREAATKTSQALRRQLAAPDIQYAVDLIQRLKEYHRTKKWDSAIEWYQPLRLTLATIGAGFPGLTDSQKLILGGAREQVRLLEDQASTLMQLQALDEPPTQLLAVINAIQSDLENILSDLKLSLPTNNREGEEDDH
ncbi:MAG: hypothetical protein HYU30_07430 [Chloroflexi bacterium]|nr:hypothetical protein [Chloroflexota bacterium]